MSNIQKLDHDLIVSLDDTVWDNFCYSSEEASPFMFSWYIRIVSQNFIKYFYVKDLKKLAGVLIYLDDKGNPKETKGIPSVYHSICYSKELSLDKNLKTQTIRLKVMNDVINYLLKVYNEKIFFSFNPRVKDLRSLSWLSYNNPKKKCNITLRYTAIKYLEKFNSINSLLLDIRSTRKYEYKKSFSKKFIVTNYVSLNEFLGLHEKTLKRQNIIVSIEDENNLKNFYNSLKNDNSFLTVVRDEKNTAVSLVACLIDSSTAYSLFIFNDENYRDFFTGTRCILESIMFAKKIGKKFFDFVGANSPNRSDFKISFRAELTPYYQAEIFNVN
jgi:hypothetical protein